MRENYAMSEEQEKIIKEMTEKLHSTAPDLLSMSTDLNIPDSLKIASILANQASLNTALSVIIKLISKDK